MSETNINIGRIKNNGETYLTLTFPGKMIALPAGASTELYPIPLEAPGIPLKIVLQVAASGVAGSQTMWLSYTEEKSMNQFTYSVKSESSGQKAVQVPTTPGSDIQLDIEYSGDGVVIVGTGDM